MVTLSGVELESPLTKISELTSQIFDLGCARDDTPGCKHVIHFNNAGAALMPKRVVDAIIDHIRLESEIGGYEAAERAHDAVERVYQAAALLIGAEHDEIAMLENATRAWDMAFYAVPLKAGDRILTSMVEYGSNFIAFLQRTQRTGATVEAIPNDEHGQVSVEALGEMIDERVKLIAVTHVPTNGGLVNPAAEIGKIAREAGVLYLLDACQSIGQLPLNVKQIGCDMLSATGRKYLRGPRGTGFLYVRRQLIQRLEPPFLDVRAAQWVGSNRYEIRPDARRFENWETNYATKIGLGVAIDYALHWGLDTIRERVMSLAENLRAQLSTMPAVRLHDLGVERCGIVSFSVEGIEPEVIKQQLASQRINVSISIRSDTLLDMESRGLGKIVRSSVHYYNSEDEIERFCRAVDAIAKGAKSNVLGASERAPTS